MSGEESTSKTEGGGATLVEPAPSSRSRGGQDPFAGHDLDLTARLYESLEGLETLRSEWEALSADYPHSTPFSTWEWLAPWWRAFAGANRDRMYVITVRDRASSLVGLAPLAVTSERFAGTELRVLRLLGDGTHDSDSLDLPVRQGQEGNFSRALLSRLTSHARDWDVCQLSTLPADSPMANRLLNALKARGWNVFTSSRPQSVIALPASWDAYLKMLSSKERGKVGLRARRLEKKYRVEVYKCQREDELDEALEALYRLHLKAWQLRGQPGTLHVPARQRFYRDLAGLLLARKQLDFWLLKVNGTIVAAQFGFRNRDTIFSLQEGFDPDYSSDSVGYVLRGHVLKAVIEDGIRKYDFLGGTDESKTRWGAEVKSYLNIEFARPFTRGSVCLVLKHRSGQTKAWLRVRLPAPLLKTLRRASAHLLTLR